MNTERNSKCRTAAKSSKIISAALALILTFSLAISLVACADKGKTVDYINDDLSKYVYISSEDYKNFPVNATLLSVNKDDVQLEINKLLIDNKDKEALYNGAAVRPSNYTIKLGDVVNIWYRGYTTDENGVKTDIKGACNFADIAPLALEIGSGTLIDGFETGLIGKPLQDKSFSKSTTGKVRRGDVIYISYKAFLPDGSPTSLSNVRIDTSDEEGVDKIYGKGFTDYFVGKIIGEEKGSNEAFRIEGEGVDTVYYEMKIDYAVRTEAEPYLLNLQFPADYKEVTLRGVEVTFEVYASTAIIYNTPTWSDSFITEKLKETAESLAAFEGATLTEKYEDKIYKELVELADDTNAALIEEEMFKHYLSKVEVKKLPEAEVQKMYDKYVSDARELYNYYSTSFKSFDEFAKYYFEITDSVKWQDYVKARAEEAVTERLVFYYIIRNEGFTPSPEEFTQRYNEIREEYRKYYLDLHKTELEACKTEEEKAAKLLEIESNMNAVYSEQYFSELVYYEYGIERLIGFADLK